jgi:hypothetical protein
VRGRDTLTGGLVNESEEMGKGREGEMVPFS